MKGDDEPRTELARRGLPLSEAVLMGELSVADVRGLLRAAMPLPQLSPQEAADLVVKHLINRIRSRHSRLGRRDPPT